VIKQMLQEWECRFPGRVESVFRSLTSVAPSQLADPSVFDFASLGSRARGKRPGPADWLLGPIDPDHAPVH